MEISVEDLAGALIRAGWFFPSQKAEALVSAQDIFAILEK